VQINPEDVKESLFSVGGTNRHSTDKHDLEPGTKVEFKGSGAIVGIDYDGYASESTVPRRIYKITCDFLEIV
jgi:hypothetical protein